MARHRRIDIRMHGDEKYRRLSKPQPCGQVLWWHLLAGRQTGIIPGLCSIGEMAFSEQLEWPLKGFREAFGEVFREGMVEADWKAPLVWVPNAIVYNSPANPNVIRSWHDAWDELPECALKDKAHERLRVFAEGLGKGFGEAFAKACRKGYRNPLANQDQDQEQEAGTGSGSKSCTEPAPPASVPPPVLTFPVVGDEKNPEWGLFQSKVDEYRVSYPGIDVGAELRKARQWCIDNPTRRKTAVGMTRFLNQWLSKAQNELGRLNGFGRPSRDQELLNEIQDATRAHK